MLHTYIAEKEYEHRVQENTRRHPAMLLSSGKPAKSLIGKIAMLFTTLF